ncbi:hypothetical protein ACFQ0R_07100 [Psychroflexus salinarum]|uniref:CarboxypepD_reg-like domain-containing protein n=1 Tax=Psychroflexus salinarum TaxID=546024 RepID=A0ABW3GPE0_9FLAO
MKIQHILSLLFFALVLNSHAQSSVNGKIVENSNEKIFISNAVVITNQQRYFFSDYHGKFSIELNQGEFIHKIISKGYQDLDAFEDYSNLKMIPEKSINAREIETSRIDSISKNQFSSTNFKFKSLSKTIISNSKYDLVLRKDIDLRLTTQEGLQQKFNAISVDGLDEVVPKMVNRDIFSFDWFQTYIEIFDERFVSPFNELNSVNYKFYSIYETSEIEIISFEPVLEGFQRSFQGILLFNKSTSKIKKIQVILDADFKLNMATVFDLETGLPKNVDLNIYSGTGGTKLSFFGGGMSFGRIQKKNPSGEAQLEHRQVYYDIASGDTISPFPKSLSKILDDKNQTIPREYWENFDFSFVGEQRQDPADLKAYIEKENIENRVKRISAFDAGYLPVSIFDIDLTRIFKANNYEGIRLGIGVLTNQSFSERFRLGGFTAYGTQDGNFKYGFNGGVLLSPDRATWLNAFYDNDIEEVGMNNYLTDQRVYSLFEPRLVNITFFYKYEKYGLSLQHNFTPQLMSEFKVDKSSISQTKDYAFLNHGILYDNYDLTSATFGVRWTPNYSYSKVGKRIYVNNEFTPEVSAQISQSFNGVMDGDFNFTKLSAKIDYDFIHSWGSFSSIELGGDIGFGDIPLTHTFHAFPNSPNKDGIFDRFSVAGVKSFETMYFNEFFSTKLATLHLKHRLAPFKLSNTIQPELVLISRHAIGDFDNPEQHQNISFNTLSQGYNEAGFELNKLFFGFGLSFAYRYGAYHLPNLEDNVSFKFTFYLKL